MPLIGHASKYLIDGAMATGYVWMASSQSVCEVLPANRKNSRLACGQIVVKNLICIIQGHPGKSSEEFTYVPICSA
jgi:hypothetical protein